MPGVSTSQPPLGSAQQLGGDGGVPAAVVPGAHLGRGLHVRAEQGVDERRLADTAGPEERQRPAALGERAQLLDATAGVPAGDDHRDAERHLDQLPAGRLGVVDEVGLGQHDDRLGAAVVGQHQLALEAALVRGVAERVGQEDDVDVGGQRVGLRPGALERRPPDERRPARA